MDRCPADGQLAFRFARQNTAGQQATVGRLSRVVAPCYPSTAAYLFGQLAHRVQEVDVVAAQLVDSLEGGQRWCFEARNSLPLSESRPRILNGRPLCSVCSAANTV